MAVSRSRNVGFVTKIPSGTNEETDTLDINHEGCVLPQHSSRFLHPPCLQLPPAYAPSNFVYVFVEHPLLLTANGFAQPS